MIGRPWIAACLAGVAACAAVPGGAAEGPKFVPGTYRQIDTVTKKPLPIGNQIVLIAGKAGKIGFSVNALRQTDAGLAFIAGVLPGGPPATWSRSSADGNCRLTFESVPHGLKVTQDAAFGDCGFGTGVSATGTYVLIPG